MTTVKQTRGTQDEHGGLVYLQMSPLARARPDRARLVETFIRLAQLDSPSRREGAVARLLVAELQRLGWDVTDDLTGPDCGNVIARLPGDDALEPMLFTSHMDVVMPCVGVQPRVDGGVIVSAGDTVLGADAKASGAALLEMAQVLASHSGPGNRPPLEVIFTWGEEVGHLGAKALDVSRLRARRAYVLDGLSPVGTIVLAAPTYLAFSIRVLGRAAHAGVEPERGISAIAVAAQALAQLPWGRLDESTTANVGTIEGGSGRNAVAAEVRLEGEVRSHVAQRADNATRAIAEAFQSAATAAGGHAHVEVQQLYAGYELAESDAVVTLAGRAFGALHGGGSSRLVRSGGGSDANEFNVRGITACVLGIGAEACHSVGERISVAELERLTAWALEIVNQAAPRAGVDTGGR
jgi:tripeptide aminopeptidase